MAKIKKNAMFDKLSGAMGNVVYREMPNGETWMSSNYDFGDREFSQEQKDHQSRFQKASAYARSAAREYPIYAQLAKGTVKSPYNWALSDWFKPPVVQHIERKGDVIRVYATDNVLVERVQVTILNKQGNVIDQGEAALNGETGLWEWPTSAEGKILAEAWDLPGNRASLIAE